jgi:hypothetical protein
MRTRTLVLAATALAVLVAWVGPSTVSASHFRKCGDQPGRGAGWYNVKAANVKCATARKVAKQFWFGDPGPLGFRCDSNQIGTELSRAKCVRRRSGQKQIVKFEYGA